MPSHLILLTAGVFLAILAAGFGLSRTLGNDEARRLRERLQELGKDRVEGKPVGPDILQDTKFSAIPVFDVLLRQIPWARSIQKLLIQGRAPMRVGSFLLLTGCLAGTGVIVSIVVFRSPMLALPAAFLLGALPLGWARRRRESRVLRFERNFPDALDILTGALRSGLALTGAIQVVSEECSDPISTEFTILFEETRLGVDMRHALKNLADRVDSKELHLFVIAVLLQRDTGGNLVEILDGTAYVIRDRLRILGDVRALTAQARLSAGILSVLPVALAVFIMASAPEYMRVLFDESFGRWLLGGAAVLQLIGYFIMRRIAKIKV